MKLSTKYVVTIVNEPHRFRHNGEELEIMDVSLSPLGDEGVVSTGGISLHFTDHKLAKQFKVDQVVNIEITEDKS
jgi:hypothetical protein